MSDAIRAAARRVEPWAVAVVVAHSTAIGCALVLAPDWSANLAGFADLTLLNAELTAAGKPPVDAAGLDKPGGTG